jgi:pyruvate dehydrogenase E1 component alpha subunit
MQVSIEKLLNIFAMMNLIRLTELGIADRYKEGKMRCPTHLSIGQECVPSVLSQILSTQDLAVSTHRAHAHYLAKGGCLKAMLAEIYGKESGCSGGRGGSMHLIDETVGFKGSTAIVGNTIPLGVGLALSKKLKKESGIAVVYVGDGAIEEGVFYESANFAVVQRLPVLFVCENNLYSVYSPLGSRQPIKRKINELVAAIGLNTSFGDGNSVQESYERCFNAYDYVSDNNGPAFVELQTYRWLEHCGPNYDNDIGYRSEEEFSHWKKRDPIAQLEAYLTNTGQATKQELSSIIKVTKEKVERAFDFAERAAYPSYRSSEQRVFC